MAKKEKLDLSEVKNLIYPYIPILVGANVNGKPNYLTVGLFGWICYDSISISVYRKHYSIAGIRENNTFSINQPTAEMVRELDFCGIYSGRKKDKSKLFENFYGELETAPMIRACPVNVECKVYQTMERPVHTVFIGEVIAAYADPDYLTRGIPDITKIEPIFYGPLTVGKRDSGNYYTLGKKIGRAWKVGLDLKKHFKPG